MDNSQGPKGPKSARRSLIHLVHSDNGVDSDHGAQGAEVTEVDSSRRLTAVVHCGSHEDESVDKLLRAAARVGLEATCSPPLNGTGASRLPRASDLVIVHSKGVGGTTQHMVSRHLSAYRGRKLVVLAEDAAPAYIDNMLAEGAAGVIPARFSVEAMAAALQVTLAGEIFTPRCAGAFGARPKPEPVADTGIRDFGLTKVEREVLSLAAQGLTNLEISLRRGGVEGTVKVHMNHIFSKLNVRSRCEAIAVYLQSHNVDPEELRRAQSGDMDMKWLLATMTHEHHLKGTVLFRRGQQGDKIYYLQNGTVRLQEIEVDMRQRDLFGEIGVFAPEHKRTCTAVCATDVDLFTLSFDEVRRCYFLNPQFAFYVMYLITRRLMADRERYQDSIG